MKEFYRFNPVRDREGEVSRYHRVYADDRDFKINPRLMQQLQLNTCRETTPEGKALWLYLRLCRILKYDEGYYYDGYRKHPNDDPYTSFKIVGDVTAETPVTCFNFARIAVKLLNQIQGVHALMIAVGDNIGHFRFGYYTDKVSVDAEPSSACNHYNDMSRVKLGIEPQGLKVYNGKFLMGQLQKRMTPQMLAQPQGLRPFIDAIRNMRTFPKHTQVNLNYLIQELKAQGVDGAGVVQFLFDMNRHFSQPPYCFMRMALNADASPDYRNLHPLLLVRESGGRKIFQIDLQTLDLEELSSAIYHQARQSGKLILPYDEANGIVSHPTNFELGLER